MNKRVLVAAAGLSAVVGMVCVVGSWRRLSATFDEPNHLSTGLEWLQQGNYTLWTENPPLARVAVALVPYLAGARLPAPRTTAAGEPIHASSWNLGSDVLYRDGAYLRNLAQARSGTLVFFVLTVLLTGLLAARAGGLTAGAVAAVAVATLPPMLGHAGQATTDVGFVAMFLLAIWTFVRWLERPDLPRAALLGGAVALAVLTKFTTLLFFPITAAALVAGHLRAAGDRRTGLARPSRRDWLRGAALAAGLALLTVWAGYRFSFGPVADPRFITRTSFYEILKPEGQRTGLQAMLGGGTLPAPEFFYGLLHLVGHNAVGHPSYLRGQLGHTGFATFYPVALFYKAPLPFLLLVAAGLAALLSKVREPRTARDLALAAATLGILIALMTSRMNLGVRHALVVYPLWAISAAVGLARLCERLGPRQRWLAGSAVAALLLVQQGTAIAARQDFLSYFNPLAGAEPGRILLDSDLDWGQGVLALAEQSRQRQIPALKIGLRMSGTRNCEHGLPPLEPLQPHQSTTGWVAITENLYWGRTENWLLRDPCQPFSRWGAAGASHPPGWFRWLRAHQPVWRGAGMRLYHISSSTPPH